MDRKFVKWFLIFTIIVVISSLSVSCKKNKSKKKWYKVHPSQYTRFPDTRKDEVACWLQSQPTSRSIFLHLVSSPVSYDQWLEEGRSIAGIEEILIDFYVNYNGIASPNKIFHYLGEFGSFRSVPVLLKALEDNDLDDESRVRAAYAIGKIGDIKAVENMLRIYYSLDEADDSEVNVSWIKDSILDSLIEIGDPRGRKLITDELAKNPESKYYKSTLEKLDEKRNEFVVDWILRWPLKNKAKHLKGLPPFRSRKEWARYGRQIPGIEEILQALYLEKNETVNVYSIFNALGDVGSSTSVPLLVDATINDKDIDSEARLAGVYALREIGSVEAFRGLLAIVEAEKTKEEKIKLDYDIFIRPDALEILEEQKNKFPELKSVIEAAIEKYQEKGGSFLEI